MANHTNWDKWISENIRYALKNNNTGQNITYTFSEYYVGGYNGNYGSIDIVGKYAYKSPLSEDVVIEIKGSLSDLNSGKGQNFVGKYNFFATDRHFLPKLQEYYNRRYRDSEIGILVVEDDGSVTTIISAKNNNTEYCISSNFWGFNSDDEVEAYFKYVELPIQQHLDKYKPYYGLNNR